MERQTITVDIAPGSGPIQRIRLSQGDIGRQLGVYIIQNGAAVDCSGYSAHLYVLKPDKNYYEKTCSISSNLISWETAEQETPLAGECKAQIRITANGMDIGTANFIEAIEATPAAGGTASESLISSMTQYVDAAETAARTAVEAEDTVEDIISTYSGIPGRVTNAENSLAAAQDGLAIVANGNTHAAIASGQFVYVKNHGSLAEGLYVANSAIGTNATLTTSNLTADGSGGLNALKAKIGNVGNTDLQAQVISLNSNTAAVTRHTRKTSFSLSDLQAAVADQDLAKHGLKVGDETTINGHTYVIAGLNVMKGAHGYTCTSNHVGLIVIPHTTHAWNASGKTNEGADGRGAGYFNCDLQHYLENDVMAMCNTDLGSAHLYAHRKLMGNAINATGYNRFGINTGCTSGWAWKENCYISALTEAQVYGGDHWSSSGYDTGEANTLLPVFSEYKHTEIFKNEYPWLRNVSSASQACLASDTGYANGVSGVGNAYHVAGLILYH